MEVRDGFIVSVYNYCDSWCTRCHLTSYCRVFADMAAMDASCDPNLKPVVDAPLLPADEPPPPPPWMQELLAEMNDAARELAASGPHERFERPIALAHQVIAERADRYCRRTRVWLSAVESEKRPWTDAHEVISWFHMLIHVKILRALKGLAEDDPDERDWPADFDGSAKVALIGIDRSEAAWLDLVESGGVAASDTAPFVQDLASLSDQLERVLPNARAFVRPGFDEPDEVAKLAGT